jgi:hypothetical protein
VCVGNFDQLHFCDAGPIEAAVVFSGRFIVIAHQYQAVRVLNVHGYLFLAVSDQLVDARLRQLRELFKVRGVSDVLETSGNPAPVVAPVAAGKLAFARKHLRQFVIPEGKFHRFWWLSTNHSPIG